VGEFVVCDLDGTITKKDVGIFLLERFAPGKWEPMEELYHSGEWSLKQTSLEEFKLLKQPRAAMEAYVREKVEFDPDFPNFAGMCRQKGIGLAIASEGLDFYIETVLDVMGLRGLPYYGDLAAFGEYLLEDVFFPNWNIDCGECGTCKVKIIQKYKEWGNRVTFIGDGRTDRHGAEVADRVFAKGILLEHCREKRINCEEYDNFATVMKKMMIDE
jgi:2,3-diketo-5-methylthio-1-phosphopentane phosphatase